jgi:hypothetical protein
MFADAVDDRGSLDGQKFPGDLPVLRHQKVPRREPSFFAEENGMFSVGHGREVAGYFTPLISDCIEEGLGATVFDPKDWEGA